MGELRDRMYRSMVLGNLSEKTQEAYLYHMREYTRYHKKSPVLLNEEHACQYLFHLSEDLARSYSNVNVARCALKYFYKNVLHRDWNETNIIPPAKGERRLPIDLSRQEIKRLLVAVDNPTYRVMLMTIYSAGLRVSEAANLRVFDIDGDRMRIFVWKRIEACRTSVLGGHIKECDQCGAEQPAYNSCRNRHCPKCGWLVQQKWLAARKKEILSVGYFHVVLTIPDLLNELTSYNQRVMYDILFKAGSQTLLQLGNDPKHLGAKIRILAILHIWGQNLVDHPHLHCIVPCGGLSEDEVEWIEPVKSKKCKKFFVHVNVISDLFKKKFMHYLVAAYEAGELKLEGGISHLRDANKFRHLKRELYRKSWITYCKRPFWRCRVGIAVSKPLHAPGCYLESSFDQSRKRPGLFQVEELPKRQQVGSDVT